MYYFVIAFIITYRCLNIVQCTLKTHPSPTEHSCYLVGGTPLSTMYSNNIIMINEICCLNHRNTIIKIRAQTPSIFLPLSDHRNKNKLGKFLQFNYFITII